jgi:hypothetical protein
MTNDETLHYTLGNAILCKQERWTPHQENI